MTDKEFKKLSRGELVEIIYHLQKNLQAATEENASLKEQLENRRIIIENSGSVAEAALRLNGVFEACEKAASQYLDEIKARGKKKNEKK